MVQLEKISAGDSVLGIDAQEPVTIVAVQWYGNAVLNITYRLCHNKWLIFDEK